MSEVMSARAENTPQSHRWTVADYHRMGEAGVFAPDARIELIDGEVIDMAPIGSRHAGTVNFLSIRLIEAVGHRAIVSVQNPIVLNDLSEPQPDIALLQPRDDMYRRSHPRSSDVLLVIEVAETTLPYDREDKLPLYARAGIPEVWIVDLGRPAVHLFRSPAGDGYENEQVTVTPTAVTIAVLPGTVVSLSGLFE